MYYFLPRRRNNHDDYYGDLEEAESNTLQAMLKGMISPKDKQILADLSKDNGGGDGGGKVRSSVNYGI